MRYAETGGAGQHPLAGSALATRPLDRLRQAAASERYWTLIPHAGGWALTHLDDRTGNLGNAEHVLDAGSEQDALAWASGVTGVDGWHRLGSHDGALVDEVYPLARELGRRPRAGRSLLVREEPDPDVPGATAVVVRERWDATGRDSDPLHTREPFPDVEQMLTWVSEAFDADRAGWESTGRPGEYRHR